MNNNLTICIVNYNTSDFILNSLYCLEKITKNSYNVIIRDNNSSFKDYSNLKREIQNYSNVRLYRADNFNKEGSIAHGLALNDLVSKINTNFGVIMDPDFTFLHKNWDDILINEINNEYPIIGTPADNKYSPIKKPLDFPYIFGVLFDNNVMNKYQIDFKPNFGSHEPATCKDTGYQLREIFLNNGYKGKTFINKNSLEYKKGPFNEINCSEFYLEGYNKIFASHFIGGATLGKYKYIKDWRVFFSNIKEWRVLFYVLPIIGPHILNFKGRKEKEKWLKICKQIIEKEL